MTKDLADEIERLAKHIANVGENAAIRARSDFVERHFSAILSALRGEQWQGIETAPEDGAHFLAYEGTGDMYRAAYHRDGYVMAFGGQPVVTSPEPEFWRPLPPPPKGQTDE